MRLVAIFVLALILTGLASATSLSFTSPYPTTDTGQLYCVNQPGDYCDTTAFFESDSLDTLNQGGIAPLFQQAFNNWNGTEGGGDWTLNYGGPLDGIFNITTASVDYVGNHAIGNASAGQFDIDIDVSDIDFPTLGPDESFVWVQAIYDNFGSGTTLTLDVDDPGCNSYNPGNPEYPCDSNTTATNSSATDLAFFDQPHSGFGNLGGPPVFFDANTYLAIEDLSNPSAPTLTVLDGVCYGFQNNTSATNSPLSALTPAPNVCSAESAASPEPDVSTLCVSGLIAILWIGRKKYAGI